MGPGETYPSKTAAEVHNISDLRVRYFLGDIMISMCAKQSFSRASKEPYSNWGAPWLKARWRQGPRQRWQVQGRQRPRDFKGRLAAVGAQGPCPGGYWLLASATTTGFANMWNLWPRHKPKRSLLEQATWDLGALESRLPCFSQMSAVYLNSSLFEAFWRQG
jgi:hypothetical protein